MRQLAAFLALVGSYWLAGQYSGRMAPYVSQFLEDPRAVFFVSFGVLFLVTAILFILAGKVLRRVMEITLLGWFDRFLGLLLGGVKAFLVASVVYMALEATLSSGNDLLKRSISSPYLKEGVKQVRIIIDDPEIRKLFVRKEPAIKKEPITEK